MLLSIALILLVGMSMGWICKKIKLPSLLGMMITGMTLGPYVLNLLDDSILGISAELRKIALIIILTRAGLGLDLSGLKKIGRPAVMMCFVPATFEIVGIVLLAPKLMGLSILEAAIMGAVLAAVSPAVVVPRMVKLMEEGYGVKQGIPQLILAGASVDDVYVIVLFSTFTGMMQGQSTSILSFINIPVSIFLGIGIGLLIGSCLAYYFKKVHIRDTSKVLIILSISLLLVVMEDSLNTTITFSALIAIMFIGIGLQKKREVVAKRISVKYGKLWVAAEVFLFVLVGATVNVGYLGKIVPYVSITFSANTEILDLLQSIAPETVDETGNVCSVAELVKEYPDSLSCALDPVASYEKITGKHKDDATPEEAMAAIFDKIAAGMNTSGQRFKYVDSPLAKAFRYGYLVELQEPNIVANPGVIVGLNSLLDRTATMVCQSGEIVNRHPDFIAVDTTNRSYAACRDVNASHLSRFHMALRFDKPSDDEMIERIKSNTGFDDTKTIRKMLKVQNAMCRVLQTSGEENYSCGTRELCNWISWYVLLGDAYESAKDTIIPLATQNEELMSELESCVLTEFV